MGMLQAKHDEGGTKATIDFATNTLTASPGEMGGMGQLTLIQRGSCSHTPPSPLLGLTYHLSRHRTQP